MDIIDVRSTTGSGVAVQLPAFSADPVDGDTVVVFYNVFQPTGLTPTVPTDTEGNTYDQIGANVVHAGGFSGGGMYYAKDIAGGSAFRVTCNPGGSFWECCAIVVRGLDANPYNGDWTFATGVANTLATGVSAPAPPAGSIFIACANINNSAVLVDDTGWNAIANGFDAGMRTRARNQDWNNNYDGFLQYLIADTAQNAHWTNGTGANWSAMVASFKPAADAPPAGGSGAMLLEFF